MGAPTRPAVETPSERRKVRVRVRVRRRSRRHRRERRLRRIATTLLLTTAAVVVLGILAVFPALEAGTRLREARSAMQEARTALLQGETAKAEEAFDRAHLHLEEGRSSIHNPFLRGFGFLPLAGRSPDATAALIEAALLASEAGQVLSRSVDDLPGGAAALAPRNGRIPIAPLRQLAGPLAEADRLLDEAAGIMDAAPRSWLVSPVAEGLAEFDPLLEEARHAIGAAAALTRALPSFLGAQETRRYFVAAQNPAELRGTGGLIGSYSILTVRKGRLHFSDFRPVTDLDTIPPEQVEPPNPDYAKVWDRFSSRGYWSNINMTADFPSAAVAIERLYEETEGVPLDGVIATDPFALEALMRVVGSVEVPRADLVLKAEDAVDFLTHDAYTAFPQSWARKFLLGDVAEEVLGRFIGGPVGETSDDVAPPDRSRRGDGGSSEDRVSRQGSDRAAAPAEESAEEATEEPDPGEAEEDGDQGPAIRSSTGAAAFGRVLVDIAADGHLLFHSVDPSVQSAFLETGVAGELPGPGGDYVAVVANAGSGTKIDYYLKRSVDYAIQLDEGGAGQAEATVRLVNNAPESGEPKYVIGPHPFTDHERGENFLYLGAYCAASCALDRILVDGEPGGVAPHEELGHPLFQTTVEIPSGATRSVAFRWTVAEAWTEAGGHGLYRLVIDGQVGIRPMPVSIEVEVPDGMHVTSATEGMEIAGDTAVWKGVPPDRLVLEVRFERSFLGRIWHSVLDFLTQPVASG